ncbi:MAG: histidinol dehydrogenase [Sediminibacterium sp. Gen4]|jgi:histidinol dehydrogenase|uniref:histidinol dehydrogenase n=1 Tax=unclassified Sediminibacterium TaxID=2635961 RepID=UPI0015BF0748|nr:MULTISPECIES: histidinol dehydrogenase [unclassified Sediminibacterium]MBW0160695.1 histidinol dehydrogenase [Sediminibacterium sp.]MBW0165752.1 histidinol dehydrogenase [Sediminibacterium sp.]NWK64719.1 histidinol dehydrogenase [Sediminibacterium sp. Gen4]
MKKIELPERNTWSHILQRPVIDTVTLEQQVKGVLDVVKQDGDKAVLQFTRQFDGVQLSSLVVTDEEIESAIQQVPDDLKRAIKQAANNIRVFHEKQKTAIEVVETMKGVRCWRKSVGIDKVGLYIPGGTAPLFSTILMLAIPAQIAGCKEVILCSPPDKEGKLNPAILYAASLTGVHKIFKMGGVQAIAAMAYGTETVPRVYKIFGPGNQYVTCAKQLVQHEGTAIDMPAGPSEVCVLADASANPSFVAADLLSQAEHGADSQVLLVSIDNQLIDAVIKELSVQLEQLPRKEMAVKALENSKAIFVKNMDDAIDLVNEYAAEHLIIACEQDEWIAEKITNAGSVFLGNYSPESVGDYASGTNHTLPTNGFARAYSGVSLDSFVKKITYQRLTKEGLTAIAPTVTAMAAAEGLDAHKKAVTIRL